MPLSPKRPNARKRGRPQHVPDEKTRRRVTAWAGGDIDQRLIAASLRISDTTLRKHYKFELATGKAMMDGLAISALGAAMQRGGKEAVLAAKWWTQSRMGWSEKLIVDNGSANVPMRVIVELVGDPAPVANDVAERQTARGAFDIGRHVQLVG